MALLLVLLCASGCARLLGLGDISPVSDGGVLDVAGDSDGGAALCAPTSVTFVTSYASPATEVAVTEQASFDIYQSAGMLYYETPIGGGNPPAIGSGDHPAISRDGQELFADSTSGVVEYLRSSGFIAPTIVSELGSVQPGTPVTLPSGDTAMVVASSSTSGFQEWRRPAGSATWSTYGPPFDPEGTGGAVSYPSLGADGLALVYVVTTKAPGVQEARYVRRTSTSREFSQLVVAPTTLLTSSNYLASPWFSDDCSHFYAVVGVDIGMNELAKYTLQ